jgi:hypothetical protein
MAVVGCRDDDDGPTMKPATKSCWVATANINEAKKGDILKSSSLFCVVTNMALLLCESVVKAIVKCKN